MGCRDICRDVRYSTDSEASLVVRSLVSSWHAPAQRDNCHAVDSPCGIPEAVELCGRHLYWNLLSVDGSPDASGCGAYREVDCQGGPTTSCGKRPGALDDCGCGRGRLVWNARQGSPAEFVSRQLQWIPAVVQARLRCESAFQPAGGDTPQSDFA